MKMKFKSLVAFCMACLMSVSALAVDAAVGGAVDAAVDSTVDAAMGETVDAAVGDTVEAAVDSTVEAAVTSVSVAASLNSITSVEGAVNAVEARWDEMEEAARLNEEELSALDINSLTRYAESAIERASVKGVIGSRLEINRENIEAQLPDVKRAHDKVLLAMTAKGFEEKKIRDMILPVSFHTGTDIFLTVNPDIQSVRLYGEPMADKIRIVIDTPAYSLMFHPSDLEEMNEELIMRVEKSGKGYDAKVNVQINQGEIASHLVLSLPVKGTATEDVPEDLFFIQEVSSEKLRCNFHYNEITRMVDGFIGGGGVYEVPKNGNSFYRPGLSDLGNAGIDVRKAVQSLYNKEIVDGNNGKFLPNDPIARGAFTKILINAIGCRKSGYPDAGFTDVTPRNYYYEHVNVAYRLGFINGYTKTVFGGGGTLTREQICRILLRVLNWKKVKSSKVKNLRDADALLQNYSAYLRHSSSEEVRMAVATLIDLGVLPMNKKNKTYTLNERSGVFEGSGNVLRGEIAVMVNNMYPYVHTS